MTVGDIAVTQSDIVKEIKIILILTNQSYSNERSEQFQEAAVKAIIKRNIKRLELEKNEYYNFDREDLKNELNKLANNMGLDLETLKSVFDTNEIDFSSIEEQVKVELYWNSLIFQMYKDRISVNPDEIDDKLNKDQKALLQQNGEDIKSIKFEKTNDKIVQGKFKLSHLMNFIKASHLCENMNILLTNDKPLILEYFVADLGILRFLLMSHTDG